MTSIALRRKLRVRKLTDFTKVTQQLCDRNMLDCLLLTLKSAVGVAEKGKLPTQESTDAFKNLRDSACLMIGYTYCLPISELVSPSAKEFF